MGPPAHDLHAAKMAPGLGLGGAGCPGWSDPCLPGVSRGCRVPSEAWDMLRKRTEINLSKTKAKEEETPSSRRRPQGAGALV